MYSILCELETVVDAHAIVNQRSRVYHDVLTAEELHDSLAFGPL